MFRILAFGLLIYAVWKLLSSFFAPNKPSNTDTNSQNPNQTNRNKDDDGFTPYEEVE